MESQKLKAQVELIRQVFGYVFQFKGKVFVFKIDSEIIVSPLFSILVKDLVLLHRMGIKIILVLGAKTRIDEILDTYKITWQTVDGIRVSSNESMPFIRMAAFDISTRVMTLLAENKTDAVIGNWVRARGIGIRKGIDFQSAGVVDKLKTEIIKDVLDSGLIPIFPNIGWNAVGKPYNISSDELAYALSLELQADKLFFIVNDYQKIDSEQFGIPAHFELGDDKVISQFRAVEAEEFTAFNASATNRHLLQLLTYAYRACRAGIKRVHIVDGRVEGVILKEIFSSRGSGIMVYADEHAHIRPMQHEDIPEVLRIVQPLVDKEILIPRSSEYFAEKSADFVVYEVDGIIHATGALHTYGSDAGEIACLAVDETYASFGVGKKIVNFLLDKASTLKLKKVIVLTTQTADWFHEMGFVPGKLEDLPLEKKEHYNRKRNSAILLYKL